MEDLPLSVSPLAISPGVVFFLCTGHDLDGNELFRLSYLSHITSQFHVKSQAHSKNTYQTPNPAAKYALLPTHRHITHKQEQHSQIARK
jgi:hypothetical protein